MDALYILGKGSPFGNDELRYSIRSLERYGKNINNIILVGEKPDFLDYSKVIHLPFHESGVKEYRIAAKIMHACESEKISDDFLFCNDDFFFTNPFDANGFPYFQKGDLITTKASTCYQEQLEITKSYLISQGKSTLNFDVHCPIIYNRLKFLELKKHWEYSKTTWGLVVKSIYCNMYDITGPSYQDAKLKSLITPSDFSTAELNVCFSIYDVAWKKGVEEYLKDKFQQKSKWEL